MGVVASTTTVARSDPAGTPVAEATAARASGTGASAAGGSAVDQASGVGTAPT